MTRTPAAQSKTLPKSSIAQQLSQLPQSQGGMSPDGPPTTQKAPEVTTGEPSKLTIAETEGCPKGAKDAKASAQVTALVNKLFRENRTLKEYKDARIRSGVLLDGLTMQQRLEKEKMNFVQ